MAANNQIVKKSIQIDAGDTLRTVKSLKQEISDLRDELLNLEQGTQEYDDVQKQLQEDVNDLNTVMGAHKDKAEALKGSYDDLQNQLKELKAAWKSTNDEAERDVLGQKINDLNNQLKEMDASIGDFHRNVGNYESAWNGLTGVMENGEKITDDLGKGIKAFGTAIGLSEKQVNGLSDVLKRLKDGFKIAKDITKAKEETANLSAEQAKAAATGAGLATSQKATGAAAKTMAVSETAAAGAFKATGAAAKTMAVSETAAAGATKGLSVAMRGLKAALISTGIGALVVLVGELIAQLDKLRLKIQAARNPVIRTHNEVVRKLAYELELQVQYSKFNEDRLNHELDMDKARGKSERDLLLQRKQNYKQLAAEIKEKLGEAEQLVKEYDESVEKMSKGERKRNEKDIKETKEYLKSKLEALRQAKFEYEKGIRDTVWDIDVYDEEQKHIKSTTDELRKWADLVKDPKFQSAWHSLFELDLGGNSPVEVLQKQKEAAIALVNQFKGDTSEVERYFDQMISEAEAEWQSLVEKEQQIFDERLTPAQRLENEKAEWIEKANRWGMDTTTIVKYYDQKIQEELDKAEAERRAKREAELAEIEKQTQEQLQMMEDALSTQEKLDELFNQRSMNYGNKWFETGDTVQSDIEKDMEDLQRLYDAQMQYLNGLLESADLTEEAYAGVESRILSLQVTFNNQMNELKKEADYQGKNFTLLSKKGVANITLLENAFAGFSDLAQQLGGENSEAFKGFATAQALISTFLAANRVLAEEPGTFAMKALAAAGALATGIANVMAIWGVNPDGSNAGSAMNTSMQQSATPVIGNSQPINYTRNITTAEEEDQMNQPIYVTVTDIEDGINGRRAQVENTSF